MEWHINDISLSGQFPDPLTFRRSLEPILKLRQKRPDLKTRILCSRSLHLRRVTDSHNLREAIQASRDPVFIRLALEWFATSGPFWDDDRAETPDDYFHFELEDVTDQGLGEAARRIILEGDAASFSFDHPRFLATPLAVHHGVPEDPLGQYDIANFWSLGDVETAAFVRADSWTSMLQLAQNNFDQLIFSDKIESQLRPSPFHFGVADRILDLLKILQAIAVETQFDGSLSARGLELLQNHFVGKKASFTDESESNKADFRHEMTFTDPLDASRRVFCPWHGKVKIGQFRIHFEWPRQAHQKDFKVLYIGPKITKR